MIGSFSIQNLKSSLTKSYFLKAKCSAASLPLNALDYLIPATDYVKRNRY